MSISSYRIPPVLLALAIGLWSPLIGPTPTWPQPGVRSQPSLDYSPIPGYRLTANSKPMPSVTFFHSPGRGTVLVRDEVAGNSFVIDSRRGRVALYSNADFERLDLGVLRPIAGRQAQQEVALKRVDNRPAFFYQGVEYRVADKPPLLGPQTADQIKADDGYYAVAAEKYRPTPAYLAKLRSYDKPTEIKLFFGSWCQNCHKWLPNILRVEKELAGTKISFKYYGLPRGYADPAAKELGVKSVPFGIVYQDGKEIGRIGGPSWTFPDLQLTRLLEP